MPLDYNHCLRPTLTQRFVQRLQQGAALNVLTTDKADAGRFYADVHTVLGDEVCFLYVPMRSYVQDFEGFLQVVWTQLPVAQRGETQPVEWAGVVALVQQVPQPVCLWLAQLHRLFDDDGIDPRYDRAFVGSLNSLRHAPQLSLVGETEQPLQRYVWYINGQQDDASLLELSEPFYLPHLSKKDIKAELSRWQVANQDKAAICDAVQTLESNQYSFLQFVLPQLSSGAYESLPLEKRLQNWQTDFKPSVRLPTERDSKHLRHKTKHAIKEGIRWINVFKLLSPLWQGVVKLLKYWGWLK